MSPTLTLRFTSPPSTVSLRPACLGQGLDWGSRTSDEETEAQWVPLRPSAPVLLGPPRPRQRSLLCPCAGPLPLNDRPSPLSVSGHSVDPGLAGLLGQRAPRSKQPFMVTFFRASPSPVRAPRAVRPLRKRLLKKTNELPQPNKLPGIFGEVWGWPGLSPQAFGREPVVATQPSTTQ